MAGAIAAQDDLPSTKGLSDSGRETSIALMEATLSGLATIWQSQTDRGSRMNKERDENLELPFSGKVKPAHARRKPRTGRARSSRRQLLLFDYKTWLTLTEAVASAAATAEASRTGGE